MEGDEHASQTPMNDNNMVNMNNINPYMLDYMSSTTPMINNPMFQYPPSSSSPVLPQLPVSMNDHLDHNNSNNNISLESNNVDWVSLLSGFMHGDQGSTMGRRLSDQGDDKINALRLNEKSMKIGRGKKVTPSRVAFHTRSSEDILDDGYKWRKYGQKWVKNSQHPRGGHMLRQTVANNEIMSSVATSRSVSTWKLFVGGLGPHVNSQLLREAFSVNGVVIGAKAVMDRKSGRCRGFGFVEFPNHDAAWSSIDTMDQWELYGQTVTVRWANDSPCVYTWEDGTIDDIYDVDEEGVAHFVALRAAFGEHKPRPPGTAPVIYNRAWCSFYDPFA